MAENRAMEERARKEILKDIKDLHLRLEGHYNELLMEDFRARIVDLRNINQRLAPNDTARKRQRNQETCTTWARRYQDILDARKQAERTIAMLPRMQPINFDGSNAQAFWSQFEASILYNPALDDQQKMGHLISRVAKHTNAAKLVAGFRPDGLQFMECVTEFKNQYLSYRQIRVDLIKSAQALKPLSGFENPITTATFISELRAMSLNMSTGSTDDHALILREITMKLSEDIRSQFYSYHYKRKERAGNDDSLDKPASLVVSLLKHLEKSEEIASLRMYVEGKPLVPSETKVPQADAKGSDKRPPPPSREPTKRLRTDERNKTQELLNKGICVICHSSSHATKDCNEFNPDTRYHKMRDAGLCCQCTDHLYLGGRCPVKQLCTNCKVGRHHRVICKEPPALVSASHVTISPNPQNRVCLSTLRAKATYGAKTIIVQVLFDSAAVTSLITTGTITKLEAIPQKGNPLWLAGITDGYRRIDEILPFKLSAFDDQFSITLKAYNYPRINSERVRGPSPTICQLARDQNIPIAETAADVDHVDVLIGQDWLWPFLTGDLVPLGPLIGAIRSNLGWYIAGNELDPAHDELVSSAAITSNQLQCELCQDLAVVLELPDISQDDGPLMWEEEESNIQYNEQDHRYSVRLPRRSMENLGDNYFNALGQLWSLRRKLIANGDFDEYNEVISNYVNQGFAERAPNPEVLEGTYTIPHHMVRKKGATKTPCRVVFNASSSIPGKHSLNQCLAKGTSINSDIWAVSLKFRLAPIILMTDLVKAFSQIQIDLADRDLLRYLWFSSPNDYHPSVYRMASVIFGATSSPYLLGAVLSSHARRFGTEFPQLVEQLESDGLFMDDAALAAQTETEANRLMDQAERFFAKASFSLHPWLTNEPNLVTPDRSFGDLNETHKCLGLLWNPSTDRISLKPGPPLEEKVSRRQAVSILSKFYDPLSWFAPLKTRIRFFIRDLALSSAHWDQVLSEEEYIRLNGLVGELNQVYQRQYPRTRRFSGPTSLHIFCDASPQAIGTTAYLVGPNSGERLLICAQVKIAPKKLKERASPRPSSAKINPATEVNATIPRLELMAAAMGAKLSQSLRKHLPEKIPVALYSDSEITLQRLRSDPNKQDQFEMRRLLKILEVSSPAHWHYIPSASNPADLLTRDKPLKFWIDNELWWQGPPIELHSRAKPIKSAAHSCFATQTIERLPEEENALNEGYEKAKEIFLQIWRNRISTEPELLDRLNEGKRRALTIEQYARVRLWQVVQQEMFSVDLIRLQRGSPVEDKSRIRMLRPFIDEWGLIRSTRLAQLKELDWEARHPILLASHPIVRGYIRHLHQKLFHNGMRDFRNQFSIYYHLLRARQVIRSVIGTCVRCNLFKGRAFVPPESVLPASRFESDQRPFENIGLDYIGPIKTRDGKRIYLLLATCAVTRGVHIEVTTSLSAKHCLYALERLFARRGVPKIIHSDNATTFTATNRTLAAMVRRFQVIAQDLQANEDFNIDWHFQTPRAPWIGGFFERLVQVVKNALRHTRIRRTYNLEEVYTIICQIEAVINSRPLIETSDDGVPALTPAHFFAGRSLIGIPPFPGTAASEASNDAVLRNYLAHRVGQNGFWNRFRKEYLLQIQRHHRVTNPSREPRLGELVLLSDDAFGKDRFKWPLARITRLIAGRDGAIRTAEIEVNKRKFLRPVQRLIPLEASSSLTASGPGEDVATQVAALRRARAHSDDTPAPSVADITDT